MAYGELLEDLLGEGLVVNTHIDALVELSELGEGLLSPISSNVSLGQEEL